MIQTKAPTTTIFLSLFLLLHIIKALPIEPGIHKDTIINKLAFGSCSKHDHPQPLWPHIVKYSPDLFLWLGDIVYADQKSFPLVWRSSSLPMMEYKYDAQRHNPGYKELVKRVNITGVWDDHDYGINNGGKEYEQKKESQKLLLSFLDEPATSERWEREGLYTSFTFGNSENNNKVKLYILDTRYFRSEPEDEDSDILGPAQWEWLEKEMKESKDVQINIFGSSVQFIPADIPIVERWSEFKFGREKFLNMIQKYQLSTPIILSGDVHHAELFRYVCPGESSLIVHEITSSGMTHHCGSSLPSFICNFVFDTLLFGKFSLGSYAGLNFGTVEIDWNSNPVTVDLQIRDVNGEIVMQQTVIASKTKQGNTLCSENIPRYVHWSNKTWIGLILVFVLSFFIGSLWLLYLLAKKARHLLRATPKKKL